MKRKIRQIGRTMLAAVLLLSTCLSLSVQADQETEHNQKRTVRVGYYITPGFQEYDEKTDTYSGYSYEYMLALAQYANWEYEFVPVIFADGVQMLEQGELDLMNNVSYTDERDAMLGFSDTASGSNCAYLAMDAGDESVGYQDYSAFNDLTVALRTTSIYSDRFIEYCETNQVSPKLVYYDTKEETIAALETGEADARIITSSQNVQMHIIAKFAPEDYYFAVPKENTELLLELNRAMDSLLTNDPDFEVRLDKRYYSNVSDSNTVLSEDEKTFIEEHPMITVAYDAGFYPVSYTDENGEFAGTMADIYELISRHTGIITDSRNTPRRRNAWMRCAWDRRTLPALPPMKRSITRRSESIIPLYFLWLKSWDIRCLSE